MRKVLLLFCIICMLGLAGCQKEEAQVETTKVISQGSNTKEGWWLKRNKEHQQPEFSQNVDPGRSGVSKENEERGACGGKSYGPSQEHANGFRQGQ